MNETNEVNVIYKKKVKLTFDPNTLVLSILEAEKRKGLVVNLIFTDDTELKNINLEYRMKNKATDVISFERQDGGDILISIDKAKEQAKEYKVQFYEEVARLVIHGVLHVIGYDHINNMDLKKMRPKEKKYLKAVLESK